MIKWFLLGVGVCLFSYWAGFLTSALMAVRKKDTEALDRMVCPKCGGWIYLEDDSNGYCDTCGTYLVEGELIVEGDDSDGRTKSTDTSEGN